MCDESLQEHCVANARLLGDAMSVRKVPEVQALLTYELHCRRKRWPAARETNSSKRTQRETTRGRRTAV